MPEEVEYAYEYKDHMWVRKLNAACHWEIKELWMHAVPYADLRKFGRHELYLVLKPQKIDETGRCHQSTLDGVGIYTVRGQPEHHFITIMKDGSERVFCENHHVSLSGQRCRYCDGDTSPPITEFEVYERHIMAPIEDREIDRQDIWPISTFCGVSDTIQRKFEQLVRDHQKVCHRRHFGVDNRWIFMFEPTHAVPVAAWVKVSVRCQHCGLEVVLLNEIDDDCPYAKHSRADLHL
jgi:hypothetical protein